VRGQANWLTVPTMAYSRCSYQRRIYFNGKREVPAEASAPTGWIITIGADARAVPRYMGSNAWGTVPVPYFNMTRAGSPEAFHAPRDGFGIALFDNGVFAIGPVASLIWRRKQSFSSALNGLGDVGFTYQIGGFIDYWAVR
jgi:MipA family protein